MEENEIINLLKSHRSIRKYKDKEVEDKKVKAIIECAQSASTSNFIQAYTIIRVNDKKKRNEIAHLSGDQPYINECPLFLVFCADLNRNKTACDINNKDFEGSYTETFITATVDATLAAQNALIAAEALGLGGVYIGGIRNNPREICSLLNIPLNVYPVFGMCIGYPDDNPSKKERLPIEVVFKVEEYNTKDDANRIKGYDDRIKQYYKDRTNGKREDTWTQQISNSFMKPQRPYMKEFLKEQGFDTK